VEEIIKQLKNSHLPYFNQTKPVSEARKANQNMVIDGESNESRLPTSID